MNPPYPLAGGAFDRGPTAARAWRRFKHVSALQ